MYLHTQEESNMVIVNVTGEPFKRYVVDVEDESMFDNFDPDGLPFYFGAQALRGRGVIDEQYRSLDSESVTKVTRK